VESFAGVFVLVERGSVEASQAPDVRRKMGRHPIDDDADPGPVTAIDQRGEFRRATVAACGREQAERLIAS
jgi:hypothetical protein